MLNSTHAYPRPRYLLPPPSCFELGYICSYAYFKNFRNWLVSIYTTVWVGVILHLLY
jgi:hypothetical protein